MANEVVTCIPKQYSQRSDKKEARRNKARKEACEPVFWEEFDSKFELLTEWINKHKRWPTKQDVFLVTNGDKTPYVFKLGKWIINKRHYSHGMQKGGVWHERSYIIKEQLRLLKDLEIECMELFTKP